MNQTNLNESAGSQVGRIWMVHDRGRQYGPHTEYELAMMVGASSLSRDALIWHDGVPQWIPIGNIVPVSALAPSRPVGNSESSNRIAIGLVAIFLGCFGIHKFMLGFTTAGVTMLLVGIIGGCVYGLGTLVMATIGLIEGIVYLTKTDEQFQQDYIVGKRQWF